MTCPSTPSPSISFSIEVLPWIRIGFWALAGCLVPAIRLKVSRRQGLSACLAGLPT